MAENKKGALGFLYCNPLGRVVLRLLTARWVSRLCGGFLNTSLSRPLIKKFVRGNNINLEHYHSDNFKCFNDCFCRQIKAELRPIDTDKDHLISPCDGLLTVYPVTDGLVMPIKQSEYTVKGLLGDDPVAEEFKNGYCLVFRLCVDHYHRYAYFDSGSKGKNVFIKGKLHTVRPIALENHPVFVENCREYTILNTESFGKAAQIEVGAMLVGKIKNHHSEYDFVRGEEKGMFLYGGSTVVLLLKQGTAVIKDELLAASQKGEELPVKMGECIGYKA